jgi:hypothetical protein
LTGCCTPCEFEEGVDAMASFLAVWQWRIVSK